MTACLGKSCSFSLLCVAALDVCQCVCVFSFSVSCEGGVWDLIVLIRERCLSLYFKRLPTFWHEKKTFFLSFRSGIITSSSFENVVFPIPV